MSAIKSTFRKIVCSGKKSSDIIDQFAIEKGCLPRSETKNNNINLSCSMEYVEEFTNTSGNVVTVAHRESISGETVEFIIENSFSKLIKDIESIFLTINND